MKYAQGYVAARPELEAGQVYRGTVFPDIRRMAGLPREATHRYNVTMKEIEAETDSWQVGWLLHSYFDVAWNRYFQELGLASSVFEDELKWLAVKISEERGIFETLADREAMKQAFVASANELELASGASAEVVEQWNELMRWKLDEPFTLTHWERHSVTAGYSPEENERLRGYLHEILGSAVWQERLRELHQSLGY